MYIWILAIVLVAALVSIGYTQGAIKAGITTIGLLVASALCVPLAHFVHPLFSMLGFTNPLLPLFISPVLVFGAVLTVFKVIAGYVYQRVETHYKYKAAEVQYTLWERTSARFAIALSILNATIYLVVLSVLIYVLGYPFAQLSSGDRDSFAVRHLVGAAESLKSTRMDRVVVAFDPVKSEYYQACDLIGMLYHNPLLWGRLTAYPPLLALGEKEEFRAIANDVAISQKLLEQPPRPFQELLAEPQIKSILDNTELRNQIFDIVSGLDLLDLSNYLATAKSPKYDDEKILGRWSLNVAGTVSAARRANPKLTRQLLAAMAQVLSSRANGTSLVALPDKQVTLRLRTKKMPPGAAGGGGGEDEEGGGAAPTGEDAITVTQGTWQNTGSGRYDLKLGNVSQQITTDGNRLQLKVKTQILVFEKDL
jgi:hypothetical protein